MPLSKLKDFDPNYREALNGNDVHGFSVYTEGNNEKVGSVDDLLVDENGSFRYLIVDLGFWIFGKKVLLPMGRSRINFQERRVYALGMDRDQAESLPEYKEGMDVDYDYEERVRGGYRSRANQPQDTQSLSAGTLDTSTPLDTSYSTTEPSVSTPGTVADPTSYGSMTDPTEPMGIPGSMGAPYSTTEPSVSTPGTAADRTSYGTMADPTAPIGTPTSMDEPYSTTEPSVSTPGTAASGASYGAMTDPTLGTAAGQTGYSAYDRDTYSYDQDPDLYGLRDQDHQNLRLYEERLIANKRRQKTGEVAVGKRVETETARTSIPVEKERVVIERNTSIDAGTQVTPGEATFQEGEVARMEVYEETADVRKEAFVREEISVRKEVDRDTVEAEETVRREEIDIDAQGREIEDRTGGNFGSRTTGVDLGGGTTGTGLGDRDRTSSGVSDPMTSGGVGDPMAGGLGEPTTGTGLGDRDRTSSGVSDPMTGSGLGNPMTGNRTGSGVSDPMTGSVLGDPTTGGGLGGRRTDEGFDDPTTGTDPRDRDRTGRDFTDRV